MKWFLSVCALVAGIGVAVASCGPKEDFCPTTNPTSTVFFKSIIALKAGNAIVLSPHPRARQCTCATAALVTEAAIEAGAPADLVQCITTSTLDATQALMKHPRTSVILATGGAGMVRAAYSSGKPAFGVGPGNVPILIDTSADLAQAVARVVSGLLAGIILVDWLAVAPGCPVTLEVVFIILFAATLALQRFIPAT